MNHESLKAVVEPFYRQALTATAGGDPTPVLDHLLASHFQSINAQEVKSKTTLMKQIAGLWKLIPDLKFEPHEVVTEGNKVVVRSIATGTPVGNFMGIECSGGKSFKIDTIDIHEVVDGMIVRVHHVENWAAALQQLKA